jgi:hypothetical protein
LPRLFLQARCWRIAICTNFLCEII